MPPCTGIRDFLAAVGVCRKCVESRSQTVLKKIKSFDGVGDDPVVELDPQPLTILPERQGDLLQAAHPYKGNSSQLLQREDLLFV